MRRSENQMIWISQHRLLSLCRASPEDKYNRTVLTVQRHNRRIRKFLPADSSVGIRLMRPASQHRIKQKHALLSPFRQAAVIRDRTAQIIVQLLINVHK